MGRSKDITHKIMSSIPSKNTTPEMMLRKALHSKGFRYRINYKILPGKPDIVFTRVKLAVFVDGDFWHGHNWAIRGYGSLEAELERYSEYWKNKIRRNIERDQETNVKLQNLGWTVLRFWESDIKTDLDKCALKIAKMYHKQLEELEA